MSCSRSCNDRVVSMAVLVAPYSGLNNDDSLVVVPIVLSWEEGGHSYDARFALSRFKEW